MIEAFASAVLETIRRESLLAPGDTAVVGLSGGADSIALTLVLKELSSALGIGVLAVHVDHALRDRSADDESFCAAWAKRLGVEYRSERIDWSHSGGKPASNVEALARDVRYDALRKLAAEVPRGVVVVGHHADDRLETFLAQLVRGAGPHGLSLPRYRREDGVVRPLLDRTRREILDYVRVRGGEFLTDPTNEDGSNLRSRIRAELVPLLERENPEVARAVGRTANLLSQLDRALGDLASAARADLALPRTSEPGAERRAPAPPGAGKGPETSGATPSGDIALDGARARAYHPIVLSTVLRAVFRELGPEPSPIGFEPIDRIVRAWRAGESLDLDLPGGLRVEGNGREIRIRARMAPGLSPVRISERMLPASGQIEWGGREATGGSVVRISARPVRPSPARPERLSGPGVAWLASERLKPPLKVRGRRPGDRYRPLGLGGSRKVQDLLVDRKIPREARESWPVIADEEGILWIPGFRVDERVRITEETSTALRLEVTGLWPPDQENPNAMPFPGTISPAVGTVLLAEDVIRDRVRELGAELSREYADKNPICVNILKGGFIFLADLVRAMDVHCEMDFMVVSSYEDKTESSGVVRILSDLGLNIEDRHVLIVEDIVDTGLTLEYLRDLLMARNPASLKIVTLLDKFEKREVPVPIDFVGFEIPNEFVVGYGLDYAQRFRNLPYITVLSEEDVASAAPGSPPSEGSR